MRTYSSTQAAVADLRAGKVVAYLTDAATLQYFSQARPGHAPPLTPCACRHRAATLSTAAPVQNPYPLSICGNMLVKAGNALPAAAALQRHHHN